MKNIFLNILFTLVLILITNCSDDFFDISVTDNITEDEVFESKIFAQQVLNGIYEYMIHDFSGTNNGVKEVIDLWLGVMTEDIVITSSSDLLDFYNYESLRKDESGDVEAIYKFNYRIINTCNKLIINVPDIPDILSSEVSTILGQAYTLRAYGYFNLVRLFQHTYIGHESDFAVPLVTNPEFIYQPLSTVQEIYDQIIKDLELAMSTYASVTGLDLEKVRAGPDVTMGIYADVALTMHNWSKAVEMARKARTGYSLMSKDQYKSGFNNNSNPEWMWGFKVIESIFGQNSFISHMDYTTDDIVSVAKSVNDYKKISFSLWKKIPETDVRREVFDFADSGVLARDTFKIYSFDEVPLGQKKFLQREHRLQYDMVMMRAAEMYLIEAEALASNGQKSEAISVLNGFVKTRDPDYQIADTITSQELIDEILFQRRIEFWGEGGKRFFDMKRHNLGLNRIRSSENEPFEHTTGVSKIFILSAEDERFKLPIPLIEKENNPFVN